MNKSELVAAGNAMFVNFKSAANGYFEFLRVLEEHHLCPITKIERNKAAQLVLELTQHVVSVRDRVRSAKVNYYDPNYRKLRHEVFLEQGEICQKCGATPPDSIMHIDHIKPVSRHPELFLDKNNMQVLCEACNLGKSNTDETDYRKRKSNEVG